MVLHQKARKRLFSYPVANRLLTDSGYRTVFSAGISLAINIAYALCNCFLGVFTASAWFFTMSFYYTLLGVMRFWAVLYAKAMNQLDDTAKKAQKEYAAMKRIGIVLPCLIPALIGTVILTVKESHAKTYGTIMMLTVTTYTFYKIVMAFLNLIKVKQRDSPLLCVIRSISTADAAMSVLPLQSSMLIVFDEKRGMNTHFMTVLTGSGICVILLWLGVSMILFATKRSK